MGHRKHIARLYYATLAIFIILSASYFYTIAYGTGTYPFSVVNYSYKKAVFDPTTGLDIAPNTPAPAISCSLTNNLHMVDSKGNDVTINSATAVWSPMLAVVPSTGNSLSYVKVNVYLWCNTSPLASYNYYPWLTGGTVSMTFYAHNAQGVQMISQQTQSVQVPPGGQPVSVNGLSQFIASFTEPISAIDSVMGTSGYFYSINSAVTSGSLQFKQNLNIANSPVFTYNINTLTTNFGLQGQAINPQTSSTTNQQSSIQQSSQNNGQTNNQPNGNQVIQMIVPGQQTGYVLDGTKNSQIQFSITESNYPISGQGPPTFYLAQIVNGVPSNANQIVQTLSTTPTSTTPTPQWVVNLPTSSLPSCSANQCQYEIMVSSQQTLGGVFIPSTQADFYLSTVPLQAATCADTASCPPGNSGSSSDNSNSGSQNSQQQSNSQNNQQTNQCGQGALAGWQNYMIGTTNVCSPNLAQSWQTITQNAVFIVAGLIAVVVIAEALKKGSAPRPHEMIIES